MTARHYTTAESVAALQQADAERAEAVERDRLYRALVVCADEAHREGKRRRWMRRSQIRGLHDRLLADGVAL